MAKMSFTNARDPELIRRMEEHVKEGTCHFCPDGFKSHTSPVINDGKHWFITGNDRPYPGSIHHYLIVSKRHVTQVSDLDSYEWAELREMFNWVTENFGAPGNSFFVRSGDMNLTGATLDHIHFHFLVGGPKPENATLEDAVPVVIAYKKR
jgi:diadenosine tetraphosphate (Ap4A) HIT family hydrolase